MADPNSDEADTRRADGKRAGGKRADVSRARSARSRDTWLPDLCRLPRLAMMFVVAELVVLVLALSPDGGTRWNLQRFASASGFALWLALTIAVLLCVSRKQVSRLPVVLGSTVAVVGSAWVAALGAALVHQLDRNIGFDLVPGSVELSQFAFGSAAIAALITAVVLRYLYVLDGWQAQVEASARAQADALQARIRPHFLFNSLNAITSLVRRDPVVAERALLDLSDLFRAALGAGQSGSTLREEVDLAERYLDIESLRLGDRLQVAWDKVEPLPWSLPLPRLLLQPLVENAVLHGISRLQEGGCVEVAITADKAQLRVVVRNPAPTPRTYGDEGIDGGGIEGVGNNGARHAQRSIGDRLAYAFGPQASMTSGLDAGYYRCELRIPLGKDASA